MGNLTKPLRIIDQSSAYVFEHPLKVAKAGLLVAMGCVAMEKVTDTVAEKVEDWRYAKAQGEIAVSQVVEMERGEVYDES